jgi:hypothetical protein
MLIPELGLYVPIGLYLKNPRNYLLDTTVHKTDDDFLYQTHALSFIHDEQFDILFDKIKVRPFHHDLNAIQHHKETPTRISRKKRDKPTNNISYRNRKL